MSAAGRSAAPSLVFSPQQDLAMWVMAAVALALAAGIVVLAVRKSRDSDDRADRRLHAFAHPVSTAVIRIGASLLFLVNAAACAMLAVFIHPAMWCLLAAWLTMYGCLVARWVQTAGPVDLDALDRSTSAADDAAP